MWKGLKKGFGVVLGIELGLVTAKCIKLVVEAAGVVLLANDEKAMNEIKNEKPHLYEKLKKYKAEKKEESVEEEEAQ